MPEAARVSDVLKDRVYLPTLPPPLPPTRNPSVIWEYLTKTLGPFLKNLLRSVEEDLTKAHRVVNGLTARGPDISAVAGSLTLQGRIHVVSGADTITTLEAPPGFVGWAWLISDGGAWSLATGGNISAPAHPADGEVLPIVYDVATQMWHPAGGGGGTGVDYLVRGQELLVGAKNSSNTTYTLPNGDTFALDAFGDVVGELIWKSNRIRPATGAPDTFQYRRDSLTQITTGFAPAPGDYLAFISLHVAP